jgi:hypothetical protein
MTVTAKRSSIQATAPFAVPGPVPNRLVTQVMPTAIVLFAIAAGAVHLIHNLLPMVAPLLMDASGPGGAPVPNGGPLAGGPPMAGGAPGGAPAGGLPGGTPGGLIGLIMPYMNELFLLNFLAYAVLAIAFVIVLRRAFQRMTVDGALILLSLVTLSLWATMGSPDPLGTGTAALVAEVGVIVLAVLDIILIASPREFVGRRANSGFVGPPSRNSLERRQ